LAIDFLAPQVIEISMDSLARPRSWWSRKPTRGPSAVTVKWNGQEILSDSRGSYPAGPEEIEIGTNLIGASTCASKFSGEILNSRAIEPWNR
jgi:hypothetical protein